MLSENVPPWGVHPSTFSSSSATSPFLLRRRSRRAAVATVGLNTDGVGFELVIKAVSFEICF